MASPMSDLTKAKVSFAWTSRCQESFDRIKEALTHAPCLASPDSAKPYTVVSDASIVGIGAVLLQDDRPVAFESRKLSSAEVNYSTGEQELLAVVHAETVWRQKVQSLPSSLTTVRTRSYRRNKTLVGVRHVGLSSSRDSTLNGSIVQVERMLQIR